MTKNKLKSLLVQIVEVLTMKSNKFSFFTQSNEQ